MPWTRTADTLPEPNVWLMGTVPGREYPMLVRLVTDCGTEPCWETRTGDTTPLRACSHWSYFEPLEAEAVDQCPGCGSTQRSMPKPRYLGDPGCRNAWHMPTGGDT